MVVIVSGHLIRSKYKAKHVQIKKLNYFAYIYLQNFNRSLIKKKIEYENFIKTFPIVI